MEEEILLQIFASLIIKGGNETLQEALQKTFTFEVDKDGKYIKPDRWFELSGVLKRLIKLNETQTLQELRQEVEVMKIKVCGCPPFQPDHDGQCSSPDAGWEQHNEAINKVLALIDTKINESQTIND